MATLTDKKISDSYKGILKTSNNAEITGAIEITDGNGNLTGVTISNDGQITTDGTVSFGSLKDSGENITISKFVDEADGISNNNNDTSIPTSAAVIDYVEGQISLDDLDFAADTGSGSVDLDSQVLTITGGNNVTTEASGQSVTINAVGTNLESSSTSTVVNITSSTGGDTSIGSATSTNAGILTSSDKVKLDGISAGAEVNVNADWNATTGDAQILNKPTIPTDTSDLSDVSATAPTNGQVLQYNSTSSEYEPVTLSTTAPVDSVNGQTGAVVLDADDISDASSTNKFTTASDITKLSGIEAGAEVNPTSTDELSEGSTNLYYTDARVSANSAVAANTAKVGITTQQASDITANNAKISFDSASSTKLSGIEAGADVTDTANVTAAGALMDSEVDADIKTLSLPANTTISSFGASLVDDADAAAARTTLGVDAAGTDNSTNVSLAGTPDYITISGQTITRNQIDLSTDVTGILPVGNMAATALTTVQTAASESAQLALTTQEGDVVVRTDENKTYMRNSGTSGTMSDFTLLATPTDAVTSVNGNTGAVTVAENVTTNLSVTADGTSLTVNSSDGTDASIPAATTTAWGAMTDEDKTKLDSIATGAEVNVQSDWNATTGDALILNKPTLFDGAFSSLTGTPTTISGYGITDALQLGTTSTTALAGDTTTITAQQASDITTNNAKISFDSTSSAKLAGIEAGAEVNPTASEIKTSYESNTDTNAFTDAEKTKLSGIASGAEVNVNADWNAISGDAQILNKPTIPTNNNELTNGAGYITDGNTNWDNTYGFITATSTDTLTNKSGNISQWTNDAGYTTNVGDITSVTAGTNLTGGGTSGDVTLNMATGGVGAGTYGSTADGTKIDTITVDAYGRITAVATGVTGDITGISVGTGLDGGGSSGSISITLNLNELTDMTADLVGTDQLILLDGGTQSRKAANEINTSIFNTDIQSNAIGHAIDFSSRVTLAGGVAEGTSGIIKNLQSIL